MKNIIFAVATCALCACDITDSIGEQRDALTSVVTRSVIVPPALRCKWPDDSCVPNAPAIRKLEDWKLGTRYWARDTRSSIMIYIQSPTDARRFRAYGIDLQKKTINFILEGSKQALPAFRFQMGAELADIVADNAGVDLGIWDGGVTPFFQVPPPPKGPPVGKDWLAFKAWNAALDLADAAHNLGTQDVGGFNAGATVGSPTAP